MKLGIILYSADAEMAWNAFRFGNYALKRGDATGVFLLGKGVECESLDTEKFKVTEQMRHFVDAGGKIFACGTCLKVRRSQGSDLCPLSTMEDLHNLVRESDKVVTF